MDDNTAFVLTTAIMVIAGLGFIYMLSYSSIANNIEEHRVLDTVIVNSLPVKDYCVYVTSDNLTLHDDKPIMGNCQDYLNKHMIIAVHKFSKDDYYMIDGIKVKE